MSKKFSNYVIYSYGWKVCELGLEVGLGLGWVFIVFVYILYMMRFGEGLLGVVLGLGGVYFD